jgi:hypothetical protein
MKRLPRLVAGIRPSAVEIDHLHVGRGQLWFGQIADMESLDKREVVELGIKRPLEPQHRGQRGRRNLQRLAEQGPMLRLMAATAKENYQPAIEDAGRAGDMRALYQPRLAMPVTWAVFDFPCTPPAVPVVGAEKHALVFGQSYCAIHRYIKPAKETTPNQKTSPIETPMAAPAKVSSGGTSTPRP